MKSQSFNLNNIYIDSTGIIVSKKEKEGPLGKYFNKYISNYYYDCDSFEKAQIKLTKTAIVEALLNSKYEINDIELAIGGDLSNQIFSSTCSIKEFYFPFIGNYAACASGVLSIIIASIYMSQANIENALTFTSSHLCVSERQFRYPNEYANIFKDSQTTTITGACAVILSKKINKVKVSKATVGKVVDVLSKNVNDMGTCMAYAAIDTFKTHLENNNETLSDYDLIVTGDLSKIGANLFVEELKNDYNGIENKHFDCGNNIYSKSQSAYSGGSGPACVMCVSFAYVYKQLIKEKFKRVLIIATGALHSQISIQQKESIPCIAHAIVLEVFN